MSSSRYTCIESTEMISPPICPASCNAISDLPTAVGPARKMLRGWRMEDGGWISSAVAIFNPPFSIFVFKWLSPFWLNALRQDGAEHEADDADGDADQHARGQAIMDMVGWIIAAEIFHERAGDGVADEVGGKDLPVEFFAAEQPGEQEIKQEIVHRVINFRRMHRHTGVLVAGGKIDAPRQIGRPAITTAVEKTADTAENIAQGATWREHIGDLP